MTPRENIIRAMKRDNPEYVPFSFELCPAHLKEFTRRTGMTDYEEYYDFDARTVHLGKTNHKNDFTPYFSRLKEGTTIDEWGVAYEPGSLEHFTTFLHPMENFTTPDEVYAFPLPDRTADYRWEYVFNRVNDLHAKGYAAIFNAIQIFEPAWYLRGLDNLLCDMLDDPDMAEACLKRMADIQEITAKRAAECGCDIIIFGDDIGTQKEMMMSPEVWRRWLKPDMARVIRAAKNVNPDVIAYYHSDGVIYDVIPELIEIGVDILNPVQPECVDPVKLKNMYGDKLSFWGTIGTQTTMPFGSTDDVKNKCIEMINTVGAGGGLCIAPTHMVEPDVPYENIEALVNAVRSCGRY